MMSPTKNFIGAILLSATVSMSARSAGLDDQLLAYLPLSQNLADSSPAKLPVKTTGKISIENGAAHFPGGKNWLELPSLPFNQPFAISLWIKPEGDGMSGLIEQHDKNGRDHFFHIMLRKSLQPYLGFYLNDVISPRSLQADTWAHLVFQYTGTHQEIWVDGRLLCSRQAEAYAGTNGGTYIGRNPGWKNVPAKNFQGYMRELRIYGRALSADEIAKLNIAPPGIVPADGPPENAALTTNSVASSNSAALPSVVVVSNPSRPFLSIEGSRLTITGAPGDIYDLQATANLSEWQSLATLTNLTGQVEFNDTDAAKYSQRFYRVEIK